MANSQRALHSSILNGAFNNSNGSDHTLAKLCCYQAFLQAVTAGKNIFGNGLSPCEKIPTDKISKMDIYWGIKRSSHLAIQKQIPDVSSAYKILHELAPCIVQSKTSLSVYFPISAQQF